MLNPAENKKLGDLICRYAYDAMGRLMWKKTPINVGLTQLQRKDYYYDGVRRIQEVITRPRQIIEEMPEEGLELGTGEGNDESPVQMRGGSPPPQEIDPEPVPPPTVNEQWTDREYVYGPAYVDEFILQIDRLGRVMYMLQDANYNVVALVDASGVLLEQYAYDPYGTVVAADNVDEGGATAHAINRVGFQGLFFERYDGDYTQLCIAPNVAGMYYARNRFYSPALGRFLQRDPNETGIPIITALVMNGKAMQTLMAGLDVSVLYGQGMNLYLFAGGNPINCRDPQGLWTLGEMVVVAGESSLLMNAAMSSAWAAGRFVEMVMVGMDWRTAAYNAACEGAFMFTVGLYCDIAFMAAERYLAYTAAAAASRTAATRSASAAAAAAATATAAGKGTTTLWRAVQAGEAADIASTGVFRNLGFAEGKYFATTSEGATSFARQAGNTFEGGAYSTLVKTEVPNSLVQQLSKDVVDRNVTSVVIPDEMLPALRPEIVGPIPPG